MLKIIFLCIGTTKVRGDSVGPRIGEFISKNSVNCVVYGTWDNPVTSKNINDYIDIVARCHNDDIVISIDAALGNSNDIGKIKLLDKGIIPGAALSNRAKRVGNIGILAIVGDKNKDRINELRNVKNDILEKIFLNLCKILEKYF